MAVKDGAGAPWVPLVVNNDGAATDEEFTRNIEATIARGYTRFNELIDSQAGKLSVCGFGPSLTYTYTRLSGDVMACNRAHDWLIAHGVVPRWCLLLDPLAIVADMVKPHPDVTYLVASRCNEAVFERLRGHKVVVWHAAGDSMVMDLLDKHQIHEPAVCGGTASVTRGMVVGIAMGYKDIHIFGADSSFPDGSDTHIEKSMVNEKVIDVMVDRKLFKTTPWMVLQAEDVRIICKPLDHLCKFTFHGTGLLPYVAQTCGYEVIG